MDKRALLVGLLWDVGLPAAVFYGGRAVGLSTLWSCAAAALAALTRVVCVAAVRGRLDGLAAFVGASFTVVLVITLLTGDPRILLARESILSGTAGLILVGSCAIRRPVLYALVRRAMAGDERRLAGWDERWRTQPSFRRHIVVLSSVFGSVLLADSALRLLLIALLPVDTAADWLPLLHLGTVALLVGWALWYRTRRLRAAAAAPAAAPRPQRLRTH
ncbi:VC0807 family protein [Peterkaempfera sp. SMS 1(5)a]|uniref:VC0807 family protein n=1 Tax=Peterkaempfera podocarpi TaxID=3232308 RepID=UPI003670BF58